MTINELIGPFRGSILMELWDLEEHFLWSGHPQELEYDVRLPKGLGDVMEVCTCDIVDNILIVYIY